MQVHPDKRKGLVIQHLENWTDVINVSTRLLLSYDVNSKRIILASKTNAEASLNLRKLVLHMASALPDIYEWKVVQHGTAQTVRRQPETHVSRDCVAPMLLPSCSSSLVARPRESGNDSGARALVVQTTPDNIAMRVLAEITRVMHVSGRTQIYFTDLLDVPITQIESMRDDGALQVHRNDFGEVSIQLCQGGLRYLSLATVGEPVQMMRVERFQDNSKLDMVLALLRKGWSAGNPAGPYELTSRKVFVTTMLRPASYWLCLLKAPELFGKRVPRIPHDCRDLEYQAMLRLTGNALMDFLQKMEQGFDENWIRKHLKDHADPRAIVDEGDPDDDNAGQEHGDPNEDDRVEPRPQPPRALLPPLDELPEEWARCIVHFPGARPHKVIFDHYSSGPNQRGYINCLIDGHVNCFRWRDRRLEPDRNEFCAHLMAWALEGEGLSRDYHKQGHEPSQSKISEVSERMRLEEF